MYVQDLIHLAFCAELLAGKMLKQSLGLLAARNFFTRSFLLCKKFTRIKFLRRTCWVPFGHTAHLPKSASMTWHVIASPRNEGVAIHKNNQVVTKQGKRINDKHKLQPVSINDAAKSEYRNK